MQRIPDIRASQIDSVLGVIPFSAAHGLINDIYRNIRDSFTVSYYISGDAFQRHYYAEPYHSPLMHRYGLPVAIRPRMSLIGNLSIYLQRIILLRRKAGTGYDIHKDTLLLPFIDDRHRKGKDGLRVRQTLFHSP